MSKVELSCAEIDAVEALINRRANGKVACYEALV